MSTGKFISFEGGEGSGKSTQLKLLTAAFEKSGLPFISTREPGGSVGGEKIRSLLVSGDVDAWDALTETLLFNAARADHITKLIKPAITSGKTVICDRFFDSTLVYQGIGKNLGKDFVKNLHKTIFADFMPDLTIILDIDPKEGLKRAVARHGDENRFEKLGVSFHEKIRAGFLDIAKHEPKRCVVLNAAQEVQTLHEQVVATINKNCGIKL